MKLHTTVLGGILLVVAAHANAAGPSRVLLDATGSDQVPAQLSTATLANDTASLDREPSAASWALDATAALEPRPTAFRQESREYWIDATAAQLQQGLLLRTSASGALVRLSPHADNSTRIDLATLSFRANGRDYTSSQGAQSLANQEDLHEAGMDVPEGSVVFKLANELGVGSVELIAPSAAGDYLVHVFEPASPIVLTLQAERDSVLAGEALRIDASVEGGAALERLDGLLSAPDGYHQDVAFERQVNGHFTATVEPDAAHAGGFGLWEIHAFGNASSRKASVPRDARTALAVNVATARLDGNIERIALRRRGADIVIRVGVVTALASRYQLAGVLYGTMQDGTMAPVAIAHSAAWLDAGSGEIYLQYSEQSLAKATAATPYELRDLRLVNQADMSLIERRERAAVLR